MVAVQVEAQVTVAAAVAEEAAEVEVQHLRVVEQVYNPHMILHLVQNLHQEHPVDMVIREDPGILQCQEQIQQEQRVQEAVVQVVEVALAQILQGDRVNFIV